MAVSESLVLSVSFFAAPSDYDCNGAGALTSTGASGGEIVNSSMFGISI